ncbi:phage head closure protein [Cytobacillus sp. IB215316]|uniref:phage head closure protein n=1 Tax=Cytobacillus sp. IB215316 TaxID=3097354 RepID=UPI002A104BA3|nr:phage head closure protein [Cytobacillus sp. IB215316]MDX8359823.1 phage head closure protein [Cytobacillus sp. IB215316]
MQPFKYKPKLNSGQFRHRITFIKTEMVEDELGQKIEKDDDYVTCWSDIKTMQGREYFAASAAHAERTSRFIIRYRSDIDPSMKIRFMDRIFDITHPPINDNERNLTLTIIAKERV